MTVTSETIAAFVDDELDAATRARVAASALRDPAIAAEIAAQRRLRDSLRAHFAPQAREPVPPDWITTIRAATDAAQVIPLDPARGRRGWRGSQRGWIGGAIAAALVIGVAIGSQWHRGDMLVAGPGGLIASGDLARALDTQLASAQAGAPIRILGTFRRQQGDLCRAFIGAVASGIACHGGQGWQMQQVLPGVPAQGGTYRQAGSAQADLLAAAQALAVGDPLNADQERAAQAHGWH